MHRSTTCLCQLCSPSCEKQSLIKCTIKTWSSSVFFASHCISLKCAGRCLCHCRISILIFAMLRSCAFSVQFLTLEFAIFTLPETCVLQFKKIAMFVFFFNLEQCIFAMELSKNEAVQNRTDVLGVGSQARHQLLRLHPWHRTEAARRPPPLRWVFICSSRSRHVRGFVEFCGVLSGLQLLPVFAWSISIFSTLNCTVESLTMNR